MAVISGRRELGFSAITLIPKMPVKNPAQQASTAAANLLKLAAKVAICLPSSHSSHSVGSDSTAQHRERFLYTLKIVLLLSVFRKNSAPADGDTKAAPYTH